MKEAIKILGHLFDVQEITQQIEKKKLETPIDILAQTVIKIIPPGKIEIQQFRIDPITKNLVPTTSEPLSLLGDRINQHGDFISKLLPKEGNPLKRIFGIPVIIWEPSKVN